MNLNAIQHKRLAIGKLITDLKEAGVSLSSIERLYASEHKMRLAARVITLLRIEKRKLEAMEVNAKRETRNAELPAEETTAQE